MTSQQTPLPTSWWRALRARHSRRKIIGSPANPHAEFAEDDDYSSMVANPRASTTLHTAFGGTMESPQSSEEPQAAQDQPEPRPSRLSYACATMKRHLVSAAMTMTRRRHSTPNISMSPSSLMESPAAGRGTYQTEETRPHAVSESDQAAKISPPRSAIRQSQELNGAHQLHGAIPTQTPRRASHTVTFSLPAPQMITSPYARSHGRTPPQKETRYYPSCVPLQSAKPQPTALPRRLSLQLPSVHISRLSQPKITDTRQASADSRAIDASYVKIVSDWRRPGSHFRVAFADEEPPEMFASPRASIAAIECY